MEFHQRSEVMAKAVEAERTRLLAYNDSDALTLSVPDQYQRMRFLREIEAFHQVERVQREQALRAPTEQPVRNKRGKKQSNPYWID